FHPVFGSVTSLWHDYREAGIDDPEQAALPPMPLLQQAALHTALDRLVIDEAASTVYLADPAMRLDVGAIAKGYAVEQVSRAARANGFSSGLISVGGNVCAIGSREDGPWKVGIRSPLPGSDAQTTLRTVGLRDQSLVTSGGYQRYCVSIVCGDSGLADALSTAVFNLPLEQGRQLIESLDGVEAFWVLPDGTTAESSGFSALVVLES
ncbi:MAG: FAD:protein FMN transferase, partial [Oscillospiraceae bacterium]